jgi:two-component system, OmpR family, catabolic regulation response regulator CreB
MTGRQRILVIEDEPSVAENITYALSTEGFDAVWCATGGEGLARLKESVDLIVLDVGLPDRNGFDLCREIRRTSNVPVIFLTARADEVDRVVGLELGADDYLVKPFSPRELTARIRAVLRRSGEPPAPTGAGQAAGKTPFSIDRERFAIRYFGEPLTLTRCEFRLLEVLIGQPGRVFSRENLMDRAWDEPDASMERTVDAHIKSLRAKLRAVKPDVEPIDTHRGLGYALRETW